MRSIIELEKERKEWALKTFPETTAISSILKLKEETEEILQDIAFGTPNAEEYADAIMCLFDSAMRQKNPIEIEDIIEAFEKS